MTATRGARFGRNVHLLAVGRICRMTGNDPEEAAAYLVGEQRA